MTSKRHDSRARRGSLAEVIHGESETFPYASQKKLGEQPALFDHTNWVAGEHGEPLPIVPDTSDPSLKAVPVAVHKPLVEAENLDAMRQGIRGYVSEFDCLGRAPRRVRSRRKT
jgi:hypothetical protein